MAHRFSWRRVHGPEILAYVEHDADLERWRAGVVRTPPAVENVRTTLYPGFERLFSAQVAADHEVRQRFKHRCDADTCGIWLPWVDDA